MVQLKNPSPPPPPMIVSPTGSPGWFQKPPAKKRRCRTADKRVSFGDEIVVYIETAYEITQEEKDSRWYQFIELEAFKQSAKSLYRVRIVDSNINIKKVKEEDIGKNYDLIQDQNHDEKEEEVDSIRGMGTYHPSRVRYCKKFVKHVLLAYHVKCGPGNKDHVALLSTKWSTKNKNRAIDTGKKDFMQNQNQISMPTVPAAA